MKVGHSVVRCFLCVLILLSVACSSKPSAKDAQSVPSSAQSDKAGSASKDEESITYAKNPDRFAKVETNDPPFNITNPKTAQEHFNVGVNYDHLNRLDDAIREYKIAVRMQPNWAVAHDRIALDYQKQGKIDDAIAEWKETTKYDPQFYSAYDLLAGTYEHQGKIKQAIEAYSNLLRYPPAQIPAHYQLGLWYAQIGDRQQARSHLESYRELALKTKDEPQSDRFQTALQKLRELK
jgi:tetratricopeptide (TPR) repeat protein